MKFLVLALCAAYVAAGPTQPLLRLPVNCADYIDNQISCYLVKAIHALRNAAQLANITIVEGVTFVRDTSRQRTSKSLQQSELQMLNELPNDMVNRTIRLMTMFVDASNSFVNSHSLSFNLSKQLISRTLDQGRTKLKTLKALLWPVIIAVALKFAVVIPIVFTSSAFMIFKLFVEKIILFLVGTLAYNKFFGSKTSTSSFSQNSIYPTAGWYDTGNWNANPEYQIKQPRYRSFGDDAHNLAYSAHAPVPNATE